MEALDLSVAECITYDRSKLCGETLALCACCAHYTAAERRFGLLPPAIVDCDRHCEG
jgi:hypothetical protein